MDASTTWQQLQKAVENWISRPSQKPYTGWVQAAPDGKAITTGSAFVPEASYFSIRLVEMGLAQGGKYFTNFLPMGVCLTEYTVGDERQRHPMILSNDLIASQLKGIGAKPGYIEYANMYAVRCAPVKATNASLFVGLFRMPYGDLAKQVLQIAADLTQQVGVGGDPATAAVAAGLRVAEKVYDGVSGLFGLNEVTPLFGYADGNALTESGYLLVSGPGAQVIDPKRLRIVENRLLLDGARITGFDYCLVAIEHVATLLPQGAGTINPLTSLTFHRRWREVGKLLAEKNVTEAEARIAQLRAEVVASPELTEDDRLIAIAAYDTGYEKLRHALVPPATNGAATRSARGAGSANALRNEAGQRKGIGQEAAFAVLSSMATRLQIDGDADARDPDAVFAAEAIAFRKSLAKVDRGSPALAATLAEAISGAVTRREATN